ncbi:unnamed protein product [Dibothriocephalus latus]|uniref:Uncharacterized protein n=1 Tax=Dibothriocephalus latus TaxID=60516 RepID=A0A3P7NZ01_DIBLA|nr:unnamed protein product [Dibothriocephalus latus]
MLTVHLIDISPFMSFQGILLLGVRLTQSPNLVTALQLEDFATRTQSLIAEAVQHREKCRLAQNVSVLTSNYIGPCLVGALLYCQQRSTSSAFFLPQVVERILSDGRTLSKEMQLNGTYQELIQPWALRCPPLMFTWHDKAYLGAAHGFAGILMTLLKVSDDILKPITDSHNQRHKQCNKISPLNASFCMKVHQQMPEALPDTALYALILPTITWLSELHFDGEEHYNWPSSLGNNNNRLVQWCHGAPGIIPLLLLAHTVSVPCV